MLRLIVVTPMGEVYSGECDSLHLNTPDGEKGNGGGSVGIRQNHADAMIALQKGIVRAYRSGELSVSIDCESGFATVRDNVVTIACNAASISE
ncbi:MAG: hypothetical protein IKT54_02175 [Clostridia bacterium]|nr:hypothetical protein [Clostridia bacterium]